MSDLQDKINRRIKEIKEKIGDAALSLPKLEKLKKQLQNDINDSQELLNEMHKGAKEYSQKNQETKRDNEEIKKELMGVFQDAVELEKHGKKVDDSIIQEALNKYTKTVFENIDIDSKEVKSGYEKKYLQDYINDLEELKKQVQEIIDFHNKKFSKK